MHVLAWTGNQSGFVGVVSMLSLFLGTRRRVQRVFYGWWIVAAGFALQVLHGGLLFHGFTVYFVPLQAEFGWTRALLSSGFSLTRLESGILGPLQGWAVDRLGPRRIVIVGILIFGGGFVLFGGIQSIFMFFVAFVLMALGSSLGGFLAVSATVTNWFARKRATAMGIAMTGMGVGGLLVPGLAWSMTTFGWRPTAVASGLIIWLVGIPAALLLRHKPEQYGYLPDGAQASPIVERAQRSAVATAHREEAATPEHGFTAREALRTPAFWLLSGGHASALLVVSSVSIHQVPHMVQQMQLSLEAAGGVVAYLMVMTVAGQIAGGYVADRVNKRALLVACMLGHASGLLFLAYATTVVHLVMFGTLHGLAWGIRGPTIQSLRADFFGRGSFGTILGFSSLVIMMGMMVAPIFAGWLADLRGDYRLAFTILALLTALGSVFFLFARKPVPRTLRGAAEAAGRWSSPE